MPVQTGIGGLRPCILGLESGVWSMEQYLFNIGLQVEVLQVGFGTVRNGVVSDPPLFWLVGGRVRRPS